MNAIGERVLACRTSDDYFYPGVVQQREAEKHHILFADGQTAALAPTQVRPFQLRVRDRVEVRLPVGRRYQPATVLRCEGDRVTVQYEDEDQEVTSLGLVRIHRSALTGAAPPAPQHGWIVGDRVWGKGSFDAFWYPGTVQGVTAERLHIYFDDGEREWLLLERVKKLEITLQQRVMGRWQKGATFYPGRITACEGEKVHIDYDDGDKEWTTITFTRYLHTWQVGQRIFAPWQNEPFCYAGVIRSIKGGEVLVHFDDGDRGVVYPDQLMLVQLEPGQPVYARRNRGPSYFAGHVDQRRGEDVLVVFSDGTREWLSVAMIRVQPAELLRHATSGARAET